jgi:hypothetical protein
MARRFTIGCPPGFRESRLAAVFFLSVGHADNSLNGNALQEVGFLDRNDASVYTKPDTTENRSTFFNVTGRRSLNSRISVSAVQVPLIPQSVPRRLRRHFFGLVAPFSSRRGEDHKKLRVLGPGVEGRMDNTAADEDGVAC